MSRFRSRTFALVVGALVIAGCTLVVGDGKYAVVTDGGAAAEASSADGGGGGDANASVDADAAGSSFEDAEAEDAGPCTIGTRRCVGGSVETCAPDAGWGAPWPCATGACTAGNCTGATATAPSCATSGAGRTTCGTDGGESCCLSEEMPPGTYDRAFAPDGGQRADHATVAGFRLDKYLVTVGRFREFFGAWNASPNSATPDAGAGKHVHLNGGRGLANGASSGKYEGGWASSDDGYVTLARTPSDLACDSYATWTSAAAGGHEMLPINCVNWYEAYAFCIWDGGFLPSEAEFEYAAAGGNEERNYPWGADAPGTANQYAIYGTGGTAPLCYYATSGACTGTTNIAPVGSALLGAGLWGQLDLGGDVGTWGLDSYASYVVPCTDCAYLNATAAGRVIRGGGFKYAALNLASAQRFAFPPLTDAGAPSNSDTWGVRCARAP